MRDPLQRHEIRNGDAFVDLVHRLAHEAEFDDDPRLVKIALDHQPLTMHEKLICLKDRLNGKAIHAFFAVVRELGDPNRWATS